MMNTNAEDARPAVEDEATSTESKKRRRWPTILSGIIILLIGLGIGLLSGYQSGLAMRLQSESDTRLDQLTHQYKLALLDQANGKVTTARQRIEWILGIDPNFPGGKDKLAELMIAEQLTSTPATSTPTLEPTLTPTPDLRGEEELYEQARQYLAVKQWNDVIITLETLRSTNIDYRPVDVDGMYYTALRYRGVEKILQQGSLESGIYDLTLAEKIGPLDTEAEQYRKWARLYQYAASYWEIDWERVVNLFADIYPALPSLRDSSGMTATERYRLALAGYGDTLMKREQWCEAETQYLKALEFAQDATIQPRLDEAAAKCRPPDPTEDPNQATATLDPNQQPTTDPSQPTVDPNQTITPPATEGTPQPTP